MHCSRCWVVVDTDCLGRGVAGNKGLCCCSLDRLAISQSKASLPAVCSSRASPAQRQGGCCVPQSSGFSVAWFFAGGLRGFNRVSCGK